MILVVFRSKPKILARDMIKTYGQHRYAIEGMLIMLSEIEDFDSTCQNTVLTCLNHRDRRSHGLATYLTDTERSQYLKVGRC